MRTLAVLCSAVVWVIAPSLAAASDDYGHDDSNRSLPATPAVAIPGDVSGPKTAQMDDAPYPDVGRERAEPTGIGFAFAGGPEAYAHDDASYGAAPGTREAPSSQQVDVGTMAAAMPDGGHEDAGHDGREPVRR
jgi:hypothetical protein